MRIVCLVDCYLPSPKASAKLMHDLGAALAALGQEVTLAAPNDQLRQPCSVTREDGCTVLRVRTDKIKGSGKVRRAINEIRLSSVMWARAGAFFRDHPADLIISYSPTIFYAALVNRLRELYGCPSYLILRDIFPQWALDSGVLRPGLIYRYFRRKELQQYAAASVIGVQSPANLEYFRTGLAAGKPVEVLYNWTALEQVKVDRSYRRQLGLEGKVAFFFGGNIGVAQDMDNILRLAASLRDEEDIYFLLVGEGSEVPRLQRLIRNQGLANISIQPALPQAHYLRVVGEFDVGLVSLDRNLTTHNFPGKVLSYMLHGMPTLASINPGNDLKDVMESRQAALVCLNGQDEQLRSCALRLARDPQLRQTLGRNARALLEDTFSAERAARQILSHFGP